MVNKNDRIILDTNWWISFLLSKDFSHLDTLLLTKKCRLLFSQELLDEFLDVVKRPKLKKYFTISDVRSILLTIDEVAEFVEVKSTINECRDEKDNFLLALAADGKADFLITGDKDLLELTTFRDTAIVTLNDYLKK